MPKLHANAFQYTSREQFASEVTALDQKLEHLNGDEAYAGIDRIAQMIGDGHTYVQFPPDSANFPLDVRQFGNEYRVAAVVEGNEKALGARVLKIQNTPIAEAHDRMLQFTPKAETQQLANVRIEDFLTMGMLLHAVGIIPDRYTARYTLADESGDRGDGPQRPAKPPAPLGGSLRGRLRRRRGNRIEHVFVLRYATHERSQEN